MKWVAKKLSAYLRLMRFHRPIGILLLLWPTLWALWLAAKSIPPLDVLGLFSAGCVLMRAAGCIINDYADRHIDGHVTRTKQRPLVTQEVTPTEALVLFVVLCIFAALLLLGLNWATRFLALGALILAISYPFLKRHIPIPQLGLALAFSWPIPMAFCAISHTVPPIAWLLFLANACWIIAYDTQYALMDRTDDVKIGIQSSAIWFGEASRAWILCLQALMVLSLLTVGWLAGFSAIYFYCLLLACLLLLYQAWLLRQINPGTCFRAFMNNNWVGAIIFAGIVLNFAP